MRHGCLSYCFIPLCGIHTDNIWTQFSKGDTLRKESWTKLWSWTSVHVEMLRIIPSLQNCWKKKEDNGFNVFNAVYQYSLVESWKDFTKIYYASQSNFFLEAKGIVAKWSIIKDKMALWFMFPHWYYSVCGQGKFEVPNEEKARDLAR